MTARQLAFVTDDRWTRPAVLGDPEVDRWRYLLSWTWAPAKPVGLFCGLNPSRATAEVNDHTVTKWRGFAERWGWGGLLIVNAFALRSTYPEVLRRAFDRDERVAVGPENDAAILDALSRPGLAAAVACWGSPPARRLQGRLKSVWEMISGSGVPAKCWGLTADGNPLHPLMLAYATPLRSLPPP